MKKFIAIALAALTVFSFSTVALAADTTTLTTTVPDATYTLNIPADQEIDFGARFTNIGNVTVTNSSGFAVGKNLEVTLTYDDTFKCQEVATEIPFAVIANGMAGIGADKRIDSGDILTFDGTSSGTVYETASLESSNGTIFRVERFAVDISSTDWGKALAGEYTATITFTAKVVSES